MRKIRSTALLELLARQWQLLGVAGVIGALATFFSARQVHAYLIAEQRQVWGPLEPFSFIREQYIPLSAMLLAFGLCAIICSRALGRRERWGRIGLLILSIATLIGSTGFGTLCFLAALGCPDVIRNPMALSSGLYVLFSVFFYLSSALLLLDAGITSEFQDVASSRRQPNNRLKLAARGTSGTDARLRTRAAA